MKSRDLQGSAAKHQFGVIAVHNLQEMMKKKGVDLAIECRIYEVCNPHQAKKVLEGDGAISTHCRAGSRCTDRKAGTCSPRCYRLR